MQTLALRAIGKSRNLITASILSEYGLIALQFLALLIALKINRKIEWLSPALWIFLPASMSALLFRAKFAETSKPVVHLWKLVGLLSAIYSLIHYPMLPVPDPALEARYTVLLTVWGAANFAGILCFRFPSLALLPPAFLLWSMNEAGAITGLPITIDIDVMPLTEVSMCIGLGLLIDQFIRRLQITTPSGNAPQFVGLLFYLAIAVHLANYFWSFIAKLQLDNSPLLWLTKNNPAAIFLTALDDDHILFANYPRIVDWAYWIIDSTHLATNFLVFFTQAAAIIAFFLPKRALIALLIGFDIMHVSIIIIVGANFWPWIILNVIIAFVVATSKLSEPIPIKIVATLFILLAPRFVAVAQLGWLDSGANNKLSFEAIDKDGSRYFVPTNFFTFYSYSLGHMDYDLPNPSIGFEVGSPNGSVTTNELLEAARRCDIGTLARRPELFPFKPEPFTRFVKSYHQTALFIYDTLGGFPYDFYPHHFYVPAALGDDFRSLNKHDVIAYIYKQESVCLSFHEGKMHRNLIASSDYRIDVSGK